LQDVGIDLIAETLDDTGYGMLAAVGLIAAVVILKWVFPDFPAFLPLYPVVVLSAFIGGRPAGILAWAVCTGLTAYYFPAWETYPGLGGYLVISAPAFSPDI
jgi:hypothetical protein